MQTTPMHGEEEKKSVVVSILYGNDGRKGVCWGRDHFLYLARMVPRMCLPENHPLYERASHDLAREFVCSSMEVFDTPFVSAREIVHPYSVLTGLTGHQVTQHLASEFPPWLVVRPAATYEVLLYRFALPV